MQTALPFSDNINAVQDCWNIPDGWEYVRLNDVARMESGHTPSRKISEYWKGNVFWISLKDTVALSKQVICETAETISDLGLQNSSARLLPKDTVVFCRTASVGLCSRMGTSMATSQDFVNYVCGPDLLPQFLVYTFLSTSWERLKAGSTHSTIYMPVFEKLRVFLPPLVEQARIVEILDAADAAVRTAENLIEAKTKHKRALVEQLLTGKRRFPEFAGQAWREISIGAMAKQMNERNTRLQVYPVLSCTKHYGLVFAAEYFGKRIHSEDLSDYKVVRHGWFAYATNHIEEGSIGLQELCDAGLVSPMYTVFAVDESRVDRRFLFALLKTERYRQVFASMTNASVNRRGSLRWPNFATIQVDWPSLREQRRIADTLCLADEEIALLRRELDALKKQKQGLMQKLLTGEVRVKEFAK